MHDRRIEFGAATWRSLSQVIAIITRAFDESSDWAKWSWAGPTSE